MIGTAWFRRLSRGKRVLISAAIVVVLAGRGIARLPHRPGSRWISPAANASHIANYKNGDPTGVPAALAGETLVKKGEYLAHAADCFACHTAKGGEELAGGVPFALPFGTIYSTNITPDKRTGIGTYTDAQFLRPCVAACARMAPDFTRPCHSPRTDI